MIVVWSLFGLAAVINSWLVFHAADETLSNDFRGVARAWVWVEIEVFAVCVSSFLCEGAAGEHSWGNQ